MTKLFSLSLSHVRQTAMHACTQANTQGGRVRLVTSFLITLRSCLGLHSLPLSATLSLLNMFCMHGYCSHVLHESPPALVIISSCVQASV